MKKVVHLMRKFLPPTASFIYNQISKHEQFEPYLVYCEDSPSVFRAALEKEYPAYQAPQSMLGKQLYQYTRNLYRGDRKKLEQQLRKIRPDILHIHYGVDALVYADMCSALQIPVVVSFYGYDCTSFPRRFKGLGRLWLQKKLFENPGISAYTAMSPDMEKDLLSIGCPEEKIIVHYHGSDTTPFYRERNYLDKEDIHLLIISSLTAKKGHLFLLKALQRAQQQTEKQLHLHIVGDGELKDAISMFIRQENLSRVQLHGPVDYGSAQHLQFLDNADIFIHPSIHTENGEKEGIPGALIESRSSGLPVVTTRHAGIPFIVEDQKTGLLADENDVDTLAKHIVLLAEHVELREKIGRQGQAYTVDKLDVVKKEKDLEKIYHRLISSHQKRELQEI